MGKSRPWQISHQDLMNACTAEWSRTQHSPVDFQRLAGVLGCTAHNVRERARNLPGVIDVQSFGHDLPLRFDEAVLAEKSSKAEVRLIVNWLYGQLADLKKSVDEIEQATRTMGRGHAAVRRLVEFYWAIRDWFLHMAGVARVFNEILENPLAEDRYHLHQQLCGITIGTHRAVVHRVVDHFDVLREPMEMPSQAGRFRDWRDQYCRSTPKSHREAASREADHTMVCAAFYAAIRLVMYVAGTQLDVTMPARMASPHRLDALGPRALVHIWAEVFAESALWNLGKHPRRASLDATHEITPGEVLGLQERVRKLESLLVGIAPVLENLPAAIVEQSGLDEAKSGELTEEGARIRDRRDEKHSA